MKKEIDLEKTEKVLNSSGVRLGSEMAIPFVEGKNMAPAGHIVSAIDVENGLMYCRPTQKEVDGKWYTVDLSAGL